MVSKSTNQKPKISKKYKMRQIRKSLILIIVYNDVGDITGWQKLSDMSPTCSVTNIKVMPIFPPLSQNKNFNSYLVIICISPEVHSTRIWRNIHDNYSLKGWKSNHHTITFKFNTFMKIFVSLGKHFGTTQKTKSHHIFNTTENDVIVNFETELTWNREYLIWKQRLTWKRHY